MPGRAYDSHVGSHGRGSGRGCARRSTRLVLSSVIVLGVLGWAATASSFAAALPPKILEVASEGREPHSAKVSFELRPDGAETTYSIELATEDGWQLEGEGTVPAGRLEVEVSQEISGLQPEQTYYFYVFAANAVGRDSEYGIIGPEPQEQRVPPGLGEGSGAGEPVHIEESPWVREGGERAAAEAPLREAERVAAAERAGQEAAAQAAAAAAHERELREQGERAGREKAEREAREKAAAEHSATQRCVVPKLKGDSLKAARRTLERSHCRLGSVRRTGRGSTAVVAQRSKPGVRLPVGSKVGITLGTR